MSSPMRCQFLLTDADVLRSCMRLMLTLSVTLYDTETFLNPWKCLS